MCDEWFVADTTKYCAGSECKFPQKRLFWSILTPTICGHIHVAPIFRKNVSYARRCVARRRTKVRRTVLNLAHPTGCQTSKSNLLEPIWWVWICKNWILIDKKLSIFNNSELFDALTTSNVTRSASSARFSTFDPPLNAPRLGLSTALQINIDTLKACGQHFVKIKQNCSKMCSQSRKKLPEYGLYPWRFFLWGAAKDTTEACCKRRRRENERVRAVGRRSSYA